MLDKILKRILPCKFYAKYIGIKIGKNCYISTKDFPSEPYLIEIGNNVRVAKGVSFYTHGGVYPFRRIYPKLIDIDYFGKIKIGNNIHIGEKAFIMPGVTIEDNCIIGAGSVVTKSIPSGYIVGGNPASIIGKVDGFADKISKIGHRVKHLNPNAKRKFIINLSDDDFIKKTYLIPEELKDFNKR